MTTHEQDEFDAKVAAILANRVANIRTTTEEQDRSVASKAPFIILGLVVPAAVLPWYALVLLVPAIIFVAFAWLGA